MHILTRVMGKSKVWKGCGMVLEKERKMMCGCPVRLQTGTPLNERVNGYPIATILALAPL